MATSLPAINFRDLPKSLKKVQKTFDSKDIREGVIKQIEKMMLNFVALRFATGSDANGHKWKSNAEETKFGGRWSKKYNTRPSGEKVTSDKIRLTDTEELRKSYAAEITDTSVKVGPKGDRNRTIAQVAADKWKNIITGFSEANIKLIRKEIEAYLIRKILE
jgi:hypothetical protein